MQLCCQQLDLFPPGQFVPGHAHGVDPTVVTDLGQAVFSQMLYILGVWLFRPTVDILVQALVGVPIVGLRIVNCPSSDLILINPDLAVLHP